MSIWSFFTNIFQSNAFNPLKAHIGSVICVEAVDHELEGTVRDILQYSSKGSQFADYCLDEEIHIRSDPWLCKDGKEIALLLKLYDQFGYSQEFYDLLECESGELEISQGSHIDKYFRTSAHNFDVAATIDGASGKLSYWHYVRQIENEANQPIVEHLFVEMSSDIGWFQLWHGHEICVDKIKIY